MCFGLLDCWLLNGCVACCGFGCGVLLMWWVLLFGLLCVGGWVLFFLFACCLLSC